ncbi:MAG TPA: hypothetical protein VMS08_02370, partial [Candidatus Saccharimonadia bacterium]|nr:hypothetical protein [Candidatus Saccharimonadia bacterium]
MTFIHQICTSIQRLGTRRPKLAVSILVFLAISSGSLLAAAVARGHALRVPATLAAVQVSSPTTSPSPTPTESPSSEPTPTSLPTPQPKPKPTDSTTGANLNFGIAAGGGLADIGTADLDTRFQDMRAIGVKWVRFDVDWSSIQPESSTAYDWSDYDRIVQ